MVQCGDVWMGNSWVQGRCVAVTVQYVCMYIHAVWGCTYVPCLLTVNFSSVSFQTAADLHGHLAVCVANEALKVAVDLSVRVYCRALSLLDTSTGDKVSL